MLESLITDFYTLLKYRISDLLLRSNSDYDYLLSEL